MEYTGTRKWSRLTAHWHGHLFNTWSYMVSRGIVARTKKYSLLKIYIFTRCVAWRVDCTFHASSTCGVTFSMYFRSCMY